MCMGATFPAAFFTVDLEHRRRSSKIRSGDEERLTLNEWTPKSQTKES